MTSIGRYLELGLTVILVIVLCGCVVPTAANQQREDDKPVGYKYYPTLQPGRENPGAAKQDLTALLGDGGRNPGIKYHGKKGFNGIGEKDKLSELIKGNDSSRIVFWYSQSGELQFMSFSRIPCYDNRIEVSPGLVVYYEDLTDLPVIVEAIQNDVSTGHHVAGQEYEGSVVRPYEISFPGLVSFLFANFPDAQRFADDLLAILQPMKQKQSERLALFATQAAEYRATQVRPQLSEEQRRLIVQANVLTQQRDYNGAFELYLNLLEQAPVAYPSAYFNLALLCAQMERYRPAIAYMKQYLALEPDAKDERSAQDKIYEWELKAPFIKEVTVSISTEPSDAFIEVNVSGSGKEWIYVGRAPRNASFWRTNSRQVGMVRVSKPGYLPEEKTFRFDPYPGEIHIMLSKAGEGEDSQGFLGVSFKVLPEEKAKPLGLPAGKGVLIEEVMKDSAADRAGLKVADIILAIEGSELTRSIDMPMMMASAPLGSSLKFTIVRDGVEQIVKVRIEKQQHSAN